MRTAGAATASTLPDDTQRRQAALLASFEIFVREHSPRIERFLSSMCADRALVDDAMQEALITAMDKWDVVSTHAAPLVWVRKTARYKLWHLLRQRNQHHTISMDDVPARLLTEPSTPREAEEMLMIALRRLPPRQAAVMRLTIDGYDPDEIGRELDLAVPTVRSYRATARSALKMMFEEADGATVEGRRHP